MTCSANGASELASNVRYSLGSPWYEVPSTQATFSVKDDLSGAILTTRVETPPAAPLGALYYHSLNDSVWGRTRT